MIASEDLRTEVDEIVKRAWTVDEAVKIPAPEDILLNKNHAKKLTGAVVLYADLDGSTNMVDTQGWEFSAEMYKAYLRCASQIIKGRGGEITSYDGDRVMAIFYEGAKNNNAVHAGLNLNYAVEQVIRPAYKAYYTSRTSFDLKHVVGIDSSDIHAVRIGVRSDNDITWVGSAANYAAKMCAKSEKPIWITQNIYNALFDENKLLANGYDVWRLELWNNRLIYGTDYYRGF